MRRKKTCKVRKIKKRERENPISQVLSEQTEENEEQKKINRESILNEYLSLSKRIKTKKAFKVTFKGIENLYYISFKETREQAEWEAQKYFKESFHPDFLCDKNMHYRCRGKRLQVLDSYAEDGVVPIADLLKLLKIRMSCSICGHGNYSYEDYIDKVCFISDEFSTLPYAKGIIMCYNCFKKYTGKP